MCYAYLCIFLWITKGSNYEHELFVSYFRKLHVANFFLKKNIVLKSSKLGVGSDSHQKFLESSSWSLHTPQFWGNVVVTQKKKRNMAIRIS